MGDYTDFLARKKRVAHDAGFNVPEDKLPEWLFDFQRNIVAWALRKGRAAVFADCGLGKTPIQLVWADQVRLHTGKPVLILAPLAVSEQTQREGDKFGIPVRICRDQTDMGSGINITNYEMLDHFEPDGLGGLVLDESSILKNFGGQLRKLITQFGKGIPFRLACTATPAPNDLIEIINHSDFLGIMGGKEVIALFFRQDGNTTHKWRLKGHAKQDFWRWMASWACAVRYPSDLGYDDGKFVLPKLRTIQHTVDGHVEEGLLFPVEAQTLQERQQARRESVGRRVAICAEMVNASDRPWVVWCGLNRESEALCRAIPDAIEVRGSHSHAHKVDALTGFSSGRYRVIVTKPSIAGFGMNWQHCANMAFVGLSDSFEQLYQAIRRCWRFGQSNEVTAHIVVAETEGRVVENIHRKEREAAEMMRQLVAHMSSEYTHRKDDVRYDGTQEIQIPVFLREREDVAL